MSWQNRLQTTVALSSLIAKYNMDATTVTQKLANSSTLTAWLESGGSLHLCEQQITLQIISVLARKEFTCNDVSIGVIKLEFVATQDQLADAMTKPLLFAQHNRICINFYLC